MTRPETGRLQMKGRHCVHNTLVFKKHKSYLEINAPKVNSDYL